MIEVENLSKAYGAVKAVDNITFRVEKGQILGFLGPNGAGKTTTMRILTGYLPATSGTARIAGLDVFEKSLAVRKRIGYLPETPPIYPEMSVASYLDFVARIKQVPASVRRARVNRAMEMANITDKRNQLIKRLSRGYKQRVGLAQALVHDPEVIILDEPTVGLDPKQIIEVRNLIKSLAGTHTIILSTHILPEVSVTCDRVVIINHGRIVAEDSPANLTSKLRGGETVHLEVKAGAGGADALRALCDGVEGVVRVAMEPMARAALDSAGQDSAGMLSLTIESTPGRDVRGRLAAAVVSGGHELRELRAIRLSLEDIFLQLTTEEPHEETSPAQQSAAVARESR
ncbi:MAG: ABC transporter ATP-binding protein [Acidipila sp.]|nr:ABC transporter ATP-binding protein [Acidipila sp.]